MTTETRRCGEATALLTDIAAGDRDAWRTVMEKYDGAVSGTLASFRFDEATRADVVQIVWVKLWENARSIRDARCLGSWLRTTTRRVAIEVVRQRRRTVLVADHGVFDARYVDEPDVGPDTAERAALFAGFQALSPEAQKLLSLVFAQEPLPYTEIARRLERPVGSLGPTRARVLRQLRSNYETALDSGQRRRRSGSIAAA